ncbi:MAG: dephospho-CoA kinase [Desulfobulbaceae bacterium]|nr:dephospho-CoA kinase [Desulfobulbaceae bacterium]MDY0350759.1 dephospho-CoA kinase [Desulfobulbaceae bacterium]
MARGTGTPILIGITGGIGAGKSTVSGFWSRYMGLPLIDIDTVCRDLLERGKPGWLALRRTLDHSYFTAEGDLDRGRLRSALFADGELRRTINGLIHPLAREMMKIQAAACARTMILVDVPLLFEAHWQDQFHGTVVVYAGKVVRCRRIVARDGVSPDQAVLSIAAQMPLADKVLLADHVIDNSGCWLAARMQAVHLARLLDLEHGPAA